MILMPDKARDLGKVVRKLIEIGWEPLGGVGINDSGYYYQTMIMRKGIFRRFIDYLKGE